MSSQAFIKPNIKSNFWLYWIVLSTIGYIVGDSLFYLISNNCCIINKGVTIFVSASIIGVVAGSLQWLILRQQVSDVGWWILVSGISWAIGWLVKWTICVYIPMFWAWVVAGAVIGTIQGVYLQRYIHSLKWLVIWVAANTIGIAFGYYGLLVVFFSVEESIITAPTFVALIGGILGEVLTGILTGGALFFAFQSGSIADD